MLKAFSMIEVMVAMAVSSLIIFFCITTLYNFSHYYNKTLKDQEIISHFVWFTSRLNEEFKESDSIYWNNNQLIFYTQNHVTLFTFNEKNIILERDNQSLSDTLACEVKNIEIGYNSLKTVNIFQFQIKINNEFLPVNLIKEYSDPYNYNVIEKTENRNEH